MIILNENISYLIDINRLKQQDLAKMLNVSVPVVSSWIIGRASPKYDKLLLISEKFNVSCDLLLKQKLSKLKSNIGLLGAAKEVITMYGVAETGIQYDNQFKNLLQHLIKDDADIKKAILEIIGNALL